MRFSFSRAWHRNARAKPFSLALAIGRKCLLEVLVAPFRKGRRRAAYKAPGFSQASAVGILAGPQFFQTYGNRWAHLFELFDRVLEAFMDGAILLQRSEQRRQWHDSPPPISDGV